MLQSVLIPRALVPVQMEEDEPNVSVRFPVFVVAWVVSVLILLVSLAIVIGVSVNMAPGRTWQWLTLVLLAVLLHALVLLPLKILLVAAIVTLAFKRHIYTDICTFLLSRAMLEVKKRGTEDFLFSLYKLRCQPMYVPMYEQLRELKRQKKKRAKNWYAVIHFLAMLVFLTVLGFLTEEMGGHFYMNDHIRSLVTMSHLDPPIHYHSIINRTQYEKYLKSTFVDNIYKFSWYNSQPLALGNETYYRQDWMYDVITRIIDKIQIRQLRVKPGHCKIPRLIEGLNQSDCAAALTIISEDKKNYISGWLQPETTGHLDKLNWTYFTRNEVGDFNFYGFMGKYHAGGFIQDLGDSSTYTEEMVGGLLLDMWLDHYTRAVLIHSVLYNANTHLLSEATLITEQTTAGQYLPSMIITTVDVDLDVTFWTVVFLIFIFVFIVRVLFLMNIYGVLNYFTHLNHVYETLIVVLGLISVFMFFLHSSVVPQYISKFHEDPEHNHLHFFKAAYYSYNGQIILCVLFFISLLRFFSVWRFGRIYFRFLFTLYLSLCKIVLVSVIFFILYSCILWRMVGYLLSVLSIANIYNPNLIVRLGYNQISDNNKPTRHSILSFFLLYGIVFTCAVLVCIFHQEYLTAKEFWIREWNKLNILSFVWNDAFYYFGGKYRRDKKQIKDAEKNAKMRFMDF